MNLAVDVLLIDEANGDTDNLATMLDDAGYQVKAVIGMNDDVLDAVSTYQPQLLVIQTSSANIYFLNQLYQVSQESPLPIVIFTDSSEDELIKGAIQAGVSAYVVDGLASSRLKSVLEIARARFAQEQSLRSELAKTRSQLEERKVIERAKGLIMQSRNISEDEAYKALRKLAMNRNQKLAEVAADVISVSELLI